MARFSVVKPAPSTSSRSVHQGTSTGFDLHRSRTSNSVLMASRWTRAPLFSLALSRKAIPLIFRAEAPKAERLDLVRAPQHRSKTGPGGAGIKCGGPAEALVSKSVH